MIITLQTLIFFRESLLNALDRILRPYYKRFSLTFGRNGDISDDDESDEQVFAEYDEEKGVVFYPPVYLQRYAAVSDCLIDERWCGKLEKVVDLGYHDMTFIKYLKDVSGIRCILGVDIESIPLRCSSDLMGCNDYAPKRENPLHVTLFQGNAADPDYRLIGCDAVIAIEMIEHMLPQDLDRLIHTVFGFIKPWVAVFSTPNGDFNVLFKAMEKNGFRRLDHFFEWSREQFHDWCSNIVTRYPEYTVSCKGIGPGPPGTQHLGCCSQMAIFISKDYHKQQDLNLDSLALVANAPSPYNVSEMIENWDSAATPTESNMICPANNEESYTELYSCKQSCVTLLITPPNNSLAALCYHDKNSQCNLDSEAGKNYMMFDYEQMCFNVLVPRRTMDNRVYMMEDVASRLNCTTMRVNKFSKTTQNLIAKNKVDSLMHTREVVDEIRHLTRMLNFNKELPPLENGTHIWHNINWSDNAPYWNQYYKVVREYNPPFESKSDECRITDLISDEINRLIDSQFDDDLSTDVNRLEIPMELLMAVVAHITDDVEKVKDLLEWNGYEIVDNVVIHSRLVLDAGTASVPTQDDDWPDNDTYSDWDSTEVRSTTLSDGSAFTPDYHAMCLRRALDQKVRKLRSMLTADEDITTELDKIVCRLMKLALHTSKGRQSPPPTRWMQCKLLDLLTLTEKAIERRKKYFIENYPLKAISYGTDDPSEKSQEIIALEKIKEDDTALKIVDKYRHLIQSEKTCKIAESRAKYRFIDLELVDDLSVTSAEILEENECIDRHSPSLYEPESTLTDMALFPDNENTKLERTQAWLEDDLEVVPFPDHDLTFDNSSGDTDHSTSMLKRYYKKSCRKYKTKKQCIELKCVVGNISHSKTLGKDKKVRNKNSKTKVIKKVTRIKSVYNNLLRNSNDKYVSVDYRHYRVNPRKKKHKPLQQKDSQPIPASLFELCHPELMIEDNLETYKEHIINYTQNEHTVFQQPSSGVSATEKSLLIDIVMDDVEETIALRRSIGTDAEGDPMGFECETLIRSVSNTVVKDDHFFDCRDVVIENNQTIFLDDINEPSTSKGIRHVSMDVQCGPDNFAPYSILSATTSINRMPGIFNTGIKIVDSFTDTKINNTDCFTSIDDSGNKTVAPRERAIGVTINEFVPNVTEQMEYSKMTLDPLWDRSNATSPQYDTILKTKYIKENGILLKNTIQNIQNYQTESLTMMLEQESDQTKTYSAGNNINDVAPRERAIGVTIKDFVPNVTEQMEYSTMTLDPLWDRSNATSPQHDTVRRTKSIKESGILLKNPILNITNQSDSLTMMLEQKSDQTKTSSTGNNTNDVCDTTPPRVKLPGITIEECAPNVTNSSSTITHENTSDRHFVPLQYNIYNTITVREKTVGMTIDPSVKNVTEPLDPTKQERKSCMTNTSPQEFSIETKLLKPIPSGMKTEDSGSEFCGSIASIPKSNFDINCHYRKDIGVYKKTTKYVRPKLCCGGVQIHSYKDKQTSEDIMYQGEWQNNRPKVLTKRKVYNPVILKKTTDFSLKKVKSKEKTLSNKSAKSDVKPEPGKSFQGRDFSPTTKIKENVRNPSSTNKIKENMQKLSRTNKNENERSSTSKTIESMRSLSPTNKIKDHMRTTKIKANVRYPSPTNKIKESMNNLSPTNKNVFVRSISPTFKIKENMRKLSPTKNIKENMRNISPTNKMKEDLRNRSPINKIKEGMEKASDRTNEFVPKCVSNVNRRPRNVPTKVTMSSVTSKNKKPTFILKQPPLSAFSNNSQKPLVKNYIPNYLRKKNLQQNKINLNVSVDSAVFNINVKENTSRHQTLIRSKTEEIKRDLLKFQNEVPGVKYLVLRNDIENKTNANDGQHAKPTTETQRRIANKRSISPQSQNSSTCSSPNSVATVRAVSVRPKNVTCRRHSATSYKTNSGTENITPDRIKKFTKRSKNGTMSDEKRDNKENNPETSRQSNTTRKPSEKHGTFNLQKKEVFMTQLKESPPLQSAANKSYKSNVMIPKTDSLIDKSSTSPSISNKKSTLKSDDWTGNENSIPASTEISNMVLVLAPPTRNDLEYQVLSRTRTPNVGYNRLVTEWMDNSTASVEDSQSSNILADMRTLVEETLDFMDGPFDKSDWSIDSETVILSRDDISNAGADRSNSPVSFRTVITNEGNSLQNELEKALNHSFDVTLGDDSSIALDETRITVTDFDLLSCKSITSASKHSEYLSADSSQGILQVQPLRATSVKDIYERKDQPNLAVNSNAGAIANQAFSGFSINGEPIVGDNTDPVNLVDSETGSMAVDVTRQAELLTGRSSDSFESCLIEEDAVVPSWLFQIISQQQAAEDEVAPPQPLMLPLQMPEDPDPLYDANGNAVDGVGMGAGAGDGRGMHSDQSQDSSGRETSLSSTATSSGASEFRLPVKNQV